MCIVPRPSLKEPHSRHRLLPAAESATGLLAAAAAAATATATATMRIWLWSRTGSDVDLALCCSRYALCEKNSGVDPLSLLSDGKTAMHSDRINFAAIGPRATSMRRCLDATLLVLHEIGAASPRYRRVFLVLCVWRINYEHREC